MTSCNCVSHGPDPGEGEGARGADDAEAEVVGELHARVRELGGLGLRWAGKWQGRRTWETSEQSHTPPCTLHGVHYFKDRGSRSQDIIPGEEDVGKRRGDDLPEEHERAEENRRELEVAVRNPP